MTQGKVRKMPSSFRSTTFTNNQSAIEVDPKEKERLKGRRNSDGTPWNQHWSLSRNKLKEITTFVEHPDPVGKGSPTSFERGIFLAPNLTNEAKGYPGIRLIERGFKKAPVTLGKGGGGSLKVVMGADSGYPFIYFQA